MRQNMAGFIVAAAVIVGLGGCGTVHTELLGRVEQDRNVTPYTNLPATTSMAEAHQFGKQLVGYYAGGFEKANNRRRLFNVGIWAATTYTTGAAGLAAHADNIFLGALTGTSLGTLEPLVNEGGPEAWVTALGKTACLSRAAATGLDDETLRAVELLRERVKSGEASDRERRALAIHEGVYLGVGNAYDQVYSEFLTRRTGSPISATAVADFVSTAKADAARLRPVTPPPLPPAEVPPSPSQAAAESAAGSLVKIQNVVQSEPRTRELFERFGTGDLKLLLPNDEAATLREVLEDPSLIVDNAAGLTSAEVSSAVDDDGKDVVIPADLLAAIQAGVDESARVREAAGKAEVAATAAAQAATSAAQKAKTAEEAAVRLEAMNTAGSQQIDFCLKAAG